MRAVRVPFKHIFAAAEKSISNAVVSFDFTLALAQDMSVAREGPAAIMVSVRARHPATKQAGELESRIYG